MGCLLDLQGIFFSGSNCVCFPTVFLFPILVKNRNNWKCNILKNSIFNTSADKRKVNWSVECEIKHKELETDRSCEVQPVNIKAAVSKQVVIPTAFIPYNPANDLNCHLFGTGRDIHSKRNELTLHTTRVELVFDPPWVKACTSKPWKVAVKTYYLVARERYGSRKQQEEDQFHCAKKTKTLYLPES